MACPDVKDGNEGNNNENGVTELHDGSVVTRNADASILFLSIIGQVEGHTLLPDNQKTTKYEHLIPTLIAASENRSVDGLMIILNTVGGDVEAGLAIAELIASVSKPTASLVIGGGHSIGVPLAVSANRSFIVPSATMTLHPVRLNGVVIGAPQTYDYMSRMQRRIFRFIAGHSAVTEARLRELVMCTDELAADLGTVVEGSEAVDIGLIDEVGGFDRALDWLKTEIKRLKNTA